MATCLGFYPHCHPASQEYLASLSASWGSCSGEREQPCLPRAPTTQDPQRAGTSPDQPIRDQRPRQCPCHRPGSSKLRWPQQEEPRLLPQSRPGHRASPITCVWKEMDREMKGWMERGGWREGMRRGTARAVESCQQNKGRALGEPRLVTVGIGELAVG